MLPAYDDSKTLYKRQIKIVQCSIIIINFRHDGTLQKLTTIKKNLILNQLDLNESEWKVFGSRCLRWFISVGLQAREKTW